jgi:PAS domain S-box-containing protein
MTLGGASILLAVTAASSFALGSLVIYQNPYRQAHRAFALLSLNLTLWALGVLAIINSTDEPTARFWLRATFVASVWIPANFLLFMGYFPRQRFEGSKHMLVLLYGMGSVLAVSAFTDQHVREVTVLPGQPPIVAYGPLFGVLLLAVLLSMLSSYPVMFRKLNRSSGLERRQIQHVLLGIFLFTTVATVTNVLGPLIELNMLETYGPVCSVMMIAIFAYAMVRYHLLDIWLIISRTTLYGALTAFVVTTYISTVWLVQWSFNNGDRPHTLLTTMIVALIIAVVLQPLKERIQLVLDRVLLKRRYDTKGLFARISQEAMHCMQLDQLLHSVSYEIEKTVGPSALSVLLTDEQAPHTLIAEYTTQPDKLPKRLTEHVPLLDYFDTHSEPLELEKLLHSRPSGEMLQLAKQLSALNAYLCVPLKTTSGLVGLLTLGQKTSKDMYSVDDLVVFTGLAGPLATAIENARLYRKLAHLNVHLSNVLSNMREGVIAVDERGNVATVNKSAVMMLGEVRVGQHMDELPKEIAEILHQTLNSQHPISDFETRLIRPSGEPVPVVMSTTCLQPAGRGSLGAMALIFDLTQVKRLEQNVQRADRLSSIGTLAAGMAHEIKNPLVSIKTFTQLLPSRYDDADFRRTFGEVVPHEVERINTIVSRLLDFARPRPTKFQPHDVRSVVEKVLALVENQLHKCGVQVDTELSESSIDVYGDEQQLHQVFLNLVLNAVDAMKESPQKHLVVRTCQSRMHLRLQGLTWLEAECAKVEFVDTGCGIAQQNLVNLFTPFFTTKDSGCGLGLSVAHGIIVEHGGEIDVVSEQGTGTCFTVTLPLAKSMMTLRAGNG